MPKHEETAFGRQLLIRGVQASMRPRAEARGNPEDEDGVQPDAQGFNEASCRSTRKLGRDLAHDARLLAASMRPRAEARGNSPVGTAPMSESSVLQ